MKEYKKILCISSTGMGNAILYIPVLRTLRKRFPGAKIDVIVSNMQAKAILENLDLVNRVIFFGKTKAYPFTYMKLLLTLRKEKYELFVTSFLDKSLKIAVLGFLAGIKDRAGFANGWWNIFYGFIVRVNEKKHEVEYNLDLLRAIGIEGTDNSIALPEAVNGNVITDKALPEVYGRTIIGFHPGSGTDLGESVKRWDVVKFALLADKLAEQYNAEIHVFGGPEELELAKTMASKMKVVPNIAIGTTILQTAANINKCDLFISNDSGLMHLAASVQIPVIGIFGPTLYWKNYPWQVPNIVVRSGLDCAPCYKFSGISCRDPRCLAGISVRAVYNQAVKLLNVINQKAVSISGGAVYGEFVLDGYSDKEKAASVTRENIFKKITVITPDFSHNCFGRAYMLAELLKSEAEVEIVGPAFSGSVWSPIEKPPRDVKYSFLSCSKLQYFFSSAFSLSKIINGDLVIISKPVLPSMFLAMIVSLRKKVPMVIDIDDWEMGFELDRFIQGNFVNSLKSSVQIFKLVICDLLARFIKNKIVSNTYLQNKYGGIVIPHARDTEYFNPENYSKKVLREKYAIKPEDKVILFLGTPREHKGIFELVNAYKKMNDSSALMMLVGFNLVEDSQKKLYDFVKESLGGRCILLEQQPFGKIPEFLSIADIVVIPQKDTYSSKGQIPAKLFDAMAMGKPIIASKINDIPEILKDCGWTYEAGNIDELVSVIKTVISDPEMAINMGKKARNKCIEKYSYYAMSRKLSEFINKGQNI
ncbi:MAG: glycosyltransferase [Elusimicrobia bacterium]|nr:glycosyltransferase [Elusimicrobiota bacterium]